MANIVEEREQAGWVSFRLTKPEAELLGVISRNMGVSKSAVMRAALRVLWDTPEKFGTAPPITTELLAEEGDSVVNAPPPRPRKRSKRGKRR